MLPVMEGAQPGVAAWGGQVLRIKSKNDPRRAVAGSPRNITQATQDDVRKKERLQDCRVSAGKIGYAVM
jgi:hypothetical protein